MTITLIRHSISLVSSRAPITLWGLTDEGIKQAQALVDDPDISSLDVLYSSLQTKALETALILAKPNAIPIRTHPGIREITSFTNKYYDRDEYERLENDFYAEEIERIADGETATEALNRFKAAIDEFRNLSMGMNRIGIVSHGNILSFYTASLMNLQPYEVQGSIGMPDIAVLDYESGVITRSWSGPHD